MKTENVLQQFTNETFMKIIKKKNMDIISPIKMWNGLFPEYYIQNTASERPF